MYAISIRTPNGKVTTLVPNRMTMGVVYAADLIHGILLDIAKELRESFPVTTFVFVDNMRVSAPSAEIKDKAHAMWKRLAKEAGLSERDEPENIFLGMEFDLSRSTTGDTVAVRPAPKNLLAIKKQTHLLTDKSPRFGALRELFSRCIYAARILRQPLAAYYGIFKFFRRHLSKGTPPKTRVNAWASMIPAWKQWVKDILSCEFISHPSRTTTKSAVLFTDASLSGWGAILIFENVISEAAGRWHRSYESGDMGTIETAAVRRAATALKAQLSSCKSLKILVDSTTALYALGKGSSPSFTVNQEV
jgi:hypothetical protein